VERNQEQYVKKSINNLYMTVTLLPKCDIVFVLYLFKIIMRPTMSKGSKFYQKKKQDQMRIDRQVAELKSKLLSYSPQQLDRARREADKWVV